MKLSCEHNYGDRLGAASSGSMAPDGSWKIEKKRKCTKCGAEKLERFAGATARQLRIKLEQAGWSEPEIEDIFDFPSMDGLITPGLKTRLQEMNLVRAELTKIDGVELQPSVLNPMVEEHGIVCEVNGLPLVIGESDFDHWRALVEQTKAKSRRAKSS